MSQSSASGFARAVALSGLTVVGALSLSVCSPGVLLAQDDVYIPEHPWLVVRAESGAAQQGTTRLKANCRSGERLVGGGYRADRPPLDAPRYPSVEASYPSSTSSWTVVVYFPDASGTLPGLTVQAYCLTKPIARVQIVSSPESRAGRDQFGRFFTSSSRVSCPSGAVLTAGGFQTTRTVSHAGHYNAWISRSMPTGGEGRATGWLVEVDAIQWTPPPAPPTTRAYAVCASPADFVLGMTGVIGTSRQRALRPLHPASMQAITAGTLVSRAVPPVGQALYSHLEGQAACPPGETAVNGGFEFSGTRRATDQRLMIPHNVYRTTGAAVGESPPMVMRKGTQAAPTPGQRALLLAPDRQALAPMGEYARTSPNPFGAWGYGGIHGSENVDVRGGLTAHVPCIKLPEVALTVRIISPADGSFPNLAFRDGSPTGHTEPIGFRAIAGDGFGNYVPGAAYSWIVEGEALGTGETLTADLPAQPCTLEQRTVRVSAEDKQGNSASDEVRIRVGGIC